MSRCAHCLDVIAKGQAVVLEEQQLKFCCHACLAVYQFLQANPHEHQQIKKQGLAVAAPSLEQQAAPSFSQLILSLVLFIQFEVILQLQLFASFFQLSSNSINILQWLTWPYFVSLQLISLLALLKQLKPFSLRYSSYPVLLILALLLQILICLHPQIIGQSMEHAMALSSVFALFVVVILWVENRLRKHLHALEPLLLVRRLTVWSNYLSALLLLVLPALFLYFLPSTSWEHALIAVLLLLLIVNPSAFRLLAPSALYFTYRSLLAEKITVRSANVLEQLAKVDVVLLSEEAKNLLQNHAQWPAQAVGLEVLDRQSSRAAELQLRLLQQQDKIVLLCVEDELSQDLQWQADVALQIETSQHKQQFADVLLDSVFALPVALKIAKRYLSSLWFAGTVLLIAQAVLAGVFLLFGQYMLSKALLFLLLSTIAMPCCYSVCHKV